MLRCACVFVNCICVSQLFLCTSDDIDYGEDGLHIPTTAYSQTEATPI